MHRITITIVVLLSVSANAVLLADPPILVGAGAAFLLYNLLPGTLAITWLLDKRLPFRHHALESYLFSLGAGYTISILGMLMLSYLPGPILRWQVLLLFDTLILCLIALIIFGDRQHAGKSDASECVRDPALLVSTGDSAAAPAQPWIWLGLTLVLAVAGVLRLPNLSYSEFHDDEATVVWHSAEVIQGRADALFIHDKGPAEILQTSATYAMVNRMNEAAARLPFTIAGIGGLVALYLLGWRLFAPLAGWSASMLLALDGYFVGFARIVQYQSLVFLMIVLVVLLVYRYVNNPPATPRYIWLASAFFATGMLAHYEAIIVLIPCTFLYYHALQHKHSSLRTWRGYAVPVIVAAIILAVFFVPFVLHPRFARTFAEITGNRLGGGFPYNNLEDFFIRTTIYSTTYYFALMTATVTVGAISLYRRTMPSWLATLYSVALVAGLLWLFRSSQWLTINDQDYAWLFFAAALFPTFVLPRVTIPERMVWLWFGLSLLLAVFFVQKPRTHVYIFFIPWSLLAGMVIACYWTGLERRLQPRTARNLALPIAAALILLFGNYAFWYFTYTGHEVLRTWQDNRPRGYWVPYTYPAQNAIFGFPFKNGWKAVGLLYADGELSAPYARNGMRAIANWYTRGLHDCSRDAANYVYTQWNEPTNKGLTRERLRPSPQAGYHLVHVVQVNGEPRLEIFSKHSDPGTVPQVHDIADYDSVFDDRLSDPFVSPSGPAANPEITSPLRYRFGDHIWLIGYHLEPSYASPGENVELTLFWKADARINSSYKVFTQIIDMTDYRKAGQRDGVPGCERYPTDEWHPGDTIVDRYTIPVVGDALPGDYTVLIGLYDDDEERIELFSADDQHLGDSLSITKITIAD